MEITADKRLFWFLKSDTKFDLSIPSTLDMYLQQIITHGNFSDVKKILKTVDLASLKDSFERIKSFLPTEIKMFWEDYFAAT